MERRSCYGTLSQYFQWASLNKTSAVIQESTELIRIKVVADGNVAPPELVIMKERIRSQLGDVEVLIEEVDAIDQTKNGKFKAVISNL
jgi:hypothetical protein